MYIKYLVLTDNTVIDLFAIMQCKEVYTIIVIY